VGCSNATILWHLDAAEWAPSTVSKAESPGSQSDVSFGSRSKIVRRAARGKGVLPPSLHPLICPTGKSVNYLSSPVFKNISVFAAPKSPLYPPPSRPTEGRIRIVRDAGRDAVPRCKATCSRSSATKLRWCGAPWTSGCRSSIEPTSTRSHCLACGSSRLQRSTHCRERRRSMRSTSSAGGGEHRSCCRGLLPAAAVSPARPAGSLALRRTYPSSSAF
jgi:hypothetical protein